MMHVRQVRASIAVEDLLIWTFQSEKAQLVDRSGLDLPAGYPEDSVVRAERNNVLGGFITGPAPGTRAAGSQTAEDAETVAEIVGRLRPFALALLVRTYARSGSRPEWRPYARHRWMPVDMSSGHEKGEVVPPWERGRNWKRQKHRNAVGRWVWEPLPTWCPVREVDAPAAIAAYRRRYLLWWTALDGLRHDLRRAGLSRWKVDDTMPAPRPWLR